MPDNCIFCKIINGSIPGKFVYQDEQLIVVEDINPQAPFHLDPFELGDGVACQHLDQFARGV